MGAASTRPSPHYASVGGLKHRETVLEGIESCVDALNGLFTGANIGQVLIKLSEPSSSAKASIFVQQRPVQPVDHVRQRTPGGCR